MSILEGKTILRSSIKKKSMRSELIKKNVSMSKNFFDIELKKIIEEKIQKKTLESSKKSLTEHNSSHSN